MHNQKDQTTHTATLNPGALAIYELLSVRSVVHEWCKHFPDPLPRWSEDLKNDPVAMKDYNDSVFYSNVSGAVERGLPQFSEPNQSDPGDDSEDNRICTINELTRLARDLVEAGHVTKKRADTINQAFENLTGHQTLIELSRR